MIPDLTPEEAHRRALADANGEWHGCRDLVALALFVAGVILAVLVLSGHVTVGIQ